MQRGRVSEGKVTWGTIISCFPMILSHKKNKTILKKRESTGYGALDVFRNCGGDWRHDNL